MKSLKVSNGGGHCHTDKEKKSYQEDHEQIDGQAVKKAGLLLHLKNHVEGAPQRTEDPCRTPDQPGHAQCPDDPPIPDNGQDIAHDSRIEGGKHVFQVAANVVQDLSIAVEVTSGQGQRHQDERDQTEDKVEGDPGGEEKPMIAVKLSDGPP